MKEDDKIRLKANHKYLVKTIQVTEIQDHLYQENVIDFEELEDLEAERTETRKSRLLLRILPKKNDQAFGHFLTALKEAESDFVVEKLLSTNVAKFKESDYTEALHDEDKIKHMQSQMYLQTELLLAAKKDIDSLKERVEKNEGMSKYASLESIMADKGLKQSHVVEILKDYFSSVDVPDMQTSHFSSPAPSPKNFEAHMATNPKSGSKFQDVFSFSPEEVQKESERMCVVIAREIGRDVVKYVVQSTLKQRISEPKNNYSKTMRRIVEEVFSKYQEIFDQFMAKLHMDNISGYETLINVADEVFNEGNSNWGRIVVLYAFAAYVTRHSVENEMEDMATVIGDFLGYYVVKKLGPWINDNGGWDAFLEKFNPSNSGESDPSGKVYKAMLWAVLGIGVSAIAGIVATRNT